LDHLIDLKEDGSYRLNMKYFEYHRGLKMTSSAFSELFGGPSRSPETELGQKEMDLARSVQEVVNITMLRMARHIRRETQEKNLCLAGGVALNCVANGLLQAEGIFDNLWIQPAAGDAGGALGAALHAWHELYQEPRKPLQGKLDRQEGSRLGPEYSEQEIVTELDTFGAKYKVLSQDDLMATASEALEQGKVIGWFQGPMEFGPRALGGRSILGDPRSAETQSTMNLKIKYRESFRPFAPSVLAEKVGDCFETQENSPYMLLVHPVKKERCLEMDEEQQSLFGIEKLKVKRSDLPAITHVDYSARIQTVHPEISPVYHQLISSFESKTGCPLVVNTSFNVRGEPIVGSPSDAYRCFMRTEMDMLIIENVVLLKYEQKAWSEDGDWRESFELD
jgi:carbamoyltransferase